MMRLSYLELMQRNQEQGISCEGCTARCCTFEANSMRIDVQEADAIATHLRSENVDTADIEARLEATILRFRLLQEYGDGRRTLTRRFYTCTFFDEERRKCTVPGTLRPLGCLAFNPTKRNPGGDQACKTIHLPNPDHGREVNSLQPIPVAVLAALRRIPAVPGVE